MIPAWLAKRKLTELYFITFLFTDRFCSKNNRVLPLTNTKLQSKFQCNRMFASSVIVLTRNVTDGRTDGQTGKHFESCSEFDYKHNGMKCFSLRALFTILEKCRVNAIYSSAFLRRL